MRMFVRIALAALVLTLPLMVAFAGPGDGIGVAGSTPDIPQPASATGSGSDADKQIEELDRSKAKASGTRVFDFKKALEQIELRPRNLLLKLDKELRRDDANAEQMRMNFSAVGLPDYGTWVGSIGEVQELATRQKTRLADVFVTVNMRKVPFKDFYKDHTKFLSQVVSGAGTQLADLKGALNHEIDACTNMQSQAKPVMDELHKTMLKIDKTLDEATENLAAAETNYEIDQELKKLARCRVGVLNLKYVLLGRRGYVKGFIEGRKKSVETRATGMAGFRTAFQTAEFEKNVAFPCRKVVDDWLEHMDETLFFAEQFVVIVEKAWTPFLNGDFYKDIPAFVGLEPDKFHERVKNVMDFAAERREVVKKSASLSAEVSKWKMLSLRVNVEMNKEFVRDTKAMADEVHEMIRTVQKDAAPDNQLIQELTQLWMSMHESKAEAIVKEILEAKLGDGNDTWADLYEDVEDGLGNKDELARLQRRFDALKSATEVELNRLYREWDDFEYWRDVNFEKAEKMFESRQGQ